MSHEPGHSDESCGGGCSHCATGGQADEAGGLVGWRLTLSAAGTFLAPLMLALVGAAVGQGGHVRQFVGGVVGLTVGVIAAVLIARILRRTPRETA